MGFKLFRHTQSSSLLDTRTALEWTRRAASDAWNPLGLLLLASAWLASVCNYALWRELHRIGHLASAGDYAFAGALMLIIFSATVLVFSPLAWCQTIKPLLTVLLLIAATGAYFMTAYSVVIDTTMLVNVLQTDMRESRDLLHWKMLLTLGLLGIAPTIWLLRQRVQATPVLRHSVKIAIVFIAACALLTLTLAIFYQNFASTMRTHTHLRFLINPLNSVFAVADMGLGLGKASRRPLLALGTDARMGPRLDKAAPVLVLVLGETGRSGNLSINGYARATTPQLAQQDVVSLRNAWSCGTNTAASVPCMFSHLGREAYSARVADHHNLLDVLHHAGMAVLWVDNQSGCKGVCERVANVSTVGTQGSPLCSATECFDAILLEQLDARIAALPPERRAKGVVVVLHGMGSHGPAYFKRSPPSFKKFQPECTSSALQDCSVAQVVNSYDNTIVYLDEVLTLTLKWLKTKANNAPTAMIYVADHGESLGENNLFLHGLPYAIAPDVQKRVPWITWQSPQFAQRSKLDNTCLRQRADTRVSHDNYFHSVLGLLDIQTSAYQSTLDLYAPCMQR